jgi:hypothetical protein
MKRRGRIKELLLSGKTDTEILAVLDKEFPLGVYLSSNKQALAGTRWNLGNHGKVVSYYKPIPTQKRNQLTNTLYREELIKKLRSFQSDPIIELYRQRALSGKTPKELLLFTVDKTIYRAFHHETPSKRYLKWRWHSDPELLLKNLLAIKNQEMFDRFAFKLGESLVSDWGAKNDLGEPSKMNIGVAMKITNLALKHFSFSYLNSNPDLIKWLHVPWDSFTLSQLQKIWQGQPTIPTKPSQGFVKTLQMYKQLHTLISDIAQEAGVPRIIYEIWAWDTAHEHLYTPRNLIGST